MLFNSVEFAVFLPVVFILYWSVFQSNLRLQNLFITVSSFFFYGWWDWRFLLLMIGTASIDFFLALLIRRERESGGRTNRLRLLILISICSNLGVLFFFKYYNFFVDSFASAFTFLGYTPDLRTLGIVLPVGISFYTFQALSYTIDVYRGDLTATRDPIVYAAFISFFPQLVAGPIERATSLLPQFLVRREFDYDRATDGTRQILWGLFKKIVVADNCAAGVDSIFSNYGSLNGSTLAIGALLFTFQIYGDFSGYSDVAIGTARLFGFELTRNFALPYFSRDIAEFWRRWHISLSTWFKDYVYIPLGGNRGTMRIRVRNIMIVFLLSGIWHGANWTFVAWGLINAVYFLPLMMLDQNRRNTGVVAADRILPRFNEAAQILLTFCMVVFAWIFFRADDLKEAFDYIGRMFTAGIFEQPQILPLKSFVFIFLLVVTEWLQRGNLHGLQVSGSRVPIVARWTVYFLLTNVVLVSSGQPKSFIYFQF